MYVYLCHSGDSASIRPSVNNSCNSLQARVYNLAPTFIAFVYKAGEFFVLIISQHNGTATAKEAA